MNRYISLGTLMKQGSTFILKAVVGVIGIIALVICYNLFPNLATNIMLEFPAVNANLVYPAVVAFYASLLPFLFALYQAIVLLGYIDKNKVFSELAVRSLKYIKYAGITMTICYAIAMPLMYHIAEVDDAPGLILIWAAFSFAPSVVAVFAAVVQRVLQNAIDIKSENDLTV